MPWRLRSLPWRVPRTPRSAPRRSRARSVQGRRRAHGHRGESGHRPELQNPAQSDGSYTLLGLPPGSYLVRVMAGSETGSAKP